MKKYFTILNSILKIASNFVYFFLYGIRKRETHSIFLFLRFFIVNFFVLFNISVTHSFVITYYRLSLFLLFFFAFIDALALIGGKGRQTNKHRGYLYLQYLYTASENNDNKKNLIAIKKNDKI